MSSDWISPSNLEPESPSARFSACSSKASGSRPLEISFGRSTISPTPTMTGMRSSETGEAVFGIFLFHFLDARLAVALRGLRFATAPQGDGYRHGVILRSGHLAASRRMRVKHSLRDQRVHVLHRLDKFF